MRKPGLYIENGLGHCRANGGSYWIHCRNGLIKSFMGLGIFITGVIHSVIPWALPFVAEEILRYLIKRTRADLKSYGVPEQDINLG